MFQAYLPSFLTINLFLFFELAFQQEKLLIKDSITSKQKKIKNIMVGKKPAFKRTVFDL
jgi:hypothetical protein